MNKNRDPFEYFTDGRDAFKDVSFKKIKEPTMWITIIIPLIGIATNIVKPEYIEKILQFSPEFSISLIEIIVFFVFLALVGFKYLEKRTYRSLQVKYRLHQIAHELRDHQIKMSRKGIDPAKITSISRVLVDEIQCYFGQILDSMDCKVAIRLKIKKDDIRYYTVARSKGFNKSRKTNSEGIPLNVGEAKLFNGRTHFGIIIYNDIDKCLGDKYLAPTKNWEEFRDEVSSLAVAPINGWDGTKKNVSMIGMLYVASKNKYALSQKHTDLLLFIADLLATIYTSYYKETKGSEDGAIVYKAS